MKLKYNINIKSAVYYQFLSRRDNKYCFGFKITFLKKNKKNT